MALAQCYKTGSGLARSTIGLALALGLALGAVTVAAQFVAAPTDLKRVMGGSGVPVRYKQVPAGICELDARVKSFSGYADVSDKQHVFFWLFESRELEPSKAPLTVWIQGGPGSSALYGLFAEVGPCGVDAFGEPYNNPYSWSNVSNMLFIDQPVPTGLSYSDAVQGYYDGDSLVSLPNKTCPAWAAADEKNAFSGCGTFPAADPALVPNSTASAAPVFYKALQGLLGAFPQYAANGINLASESYGGVWVPAYADYIAKQNEVLTGGALPIRLDSVLIGSSFSGALDFEAYYTFLQPGGNDYNYTPLSASDDAILHNALYGPGNCLDQVRDCVKRGLDIVCSAATKFCESHNKVMQVERSSEDIRFLSDNPFPYNFWMDYVNTAKVQQAIGAHVNYSNRVDLNSYFYLTGEEARPLGLADALRRLLTRNGSVALFGGDADFVCPFSAIEAQAEQLRQPGFDRAGYANLTTTDERVHGQVRQQGRLSLTHFVGAGHLVPFYKPLATLALFRRVLAGHDVQTGKVAVGPDYRTTGPSRSSFRHGKGELLPKIGKDSMYDITADLPGAKWKKGVLPKGYERPAAHP